jgi:hypothetical protein
MYSICIQCRCNKVSTVWRYTVKQFIEMCKEKEQELSELHNVEALKNQLLEAGMYEVNKAKDAEYIVKLSLDSETMLQLRFSVLLFNNHIVIKYDYMDNFGDWSSGSSDYEEKISYVDAFSHIVKHLNHTIQNCMYLENEVKNVE